MFGSLMPTSDISPVFCRGGLELAKYLHENNSYFSKMSYKSQAGR